MADIYDDINNDRGVYFSNSDGEPVKVLNILKELYKDIYNSKMYDIDVEKEIVLVKRLSGCIDANAMVAMVDNIQDDGGIQEDRMIQKKLQKFQVTDFGNELGHELRKNRSRILEITFCCGLMGERLLRDDFEEFADLHWVIVRLEYLNGL